MSDRLRLVDATARRDPVESAIETLVDAIADRVLARLAEREPADPSRLLTVDEAAGQLRSSRAAVFALIAKGRIRSFKSGRRRVIAQGDLTAYLARKREAG